MNISIHTIEAADGAREERFRWLFWHDKKIHYMLDSEVVDRIGLPKHMNEEAIREMTRLALGETLEPMENDDGVMAEMDRWMPWRTLHIKPNVHPYILEGIGLPLHVLPEHIQELTRMRLDALPVALKEAAEIAETMDFKKGNRP